MIPNDLLKAYENLDWELYISLADSLLKIDKDLLENELLTHSNKYSYYAGLGEHANMERKKCENKIEAYESELKNSARNTLSKTTVAAIQDYVSTDVPLQEMKKDLEDKTYKYGLLKSLVISMQHRKDLLVQLSSNSRAETKMITD